MRTHRLLTHALPLLIPIFGGNTFTSLAATNDLAAEGAAAATTRDDGAVQQLRLEVAELKGRLDATQTQLEAQRAIAETSLGTISTVLTYGSIIIVLVGGLAALLGYQDLRRRIDQAVTREISNALDRRLEPALTPAMQAALKKWDERFADLAERAERILPQGGDRDA